jgi:hypothetical protein
LRRIAIDPLDRALLGFGYKANPDFGGAALADLHSRNPGADKFALSGSLFCSFRGRGPFHGRNGKLGRADGPHIGCAGAQALDRRRIRSAKRLERSRAESRVLALQVRAILPPLCCGSKDKRLVSFEWRSSMPRAFNSAMFGRAARAMLVDGSVAAHAFDLIVFGVPVRFLGSLWRSGRRRMFWSVASAAVLLQAAPFAIMVYWSR